MSTQEEGRFGKSDLVGHLSLNFQFSVPQTHTFPPPFYSLGSWRSLEPSDALDFLHLSSLLRCFPFPRRQAPLPWVAPVTFPPLLSSIQPNWFESATPPYELLGLFRWWLATQPHPWAWLEALSQLHLYPSQIKPEAEAETLSTSRPIAR